jgi:diacylglycerol kinase (ATP)
MLLFLHITFGRNRSGMSKYRVIVNPTSGRGEGGMDLPKAREILTRLGLDYELMQTERPWHAAELARQAVRDGCEVVVAMGGDGTANEVLNGLMQARLAGEGTAAMGLITVGRGNDFGYGIDVPHGLEASCQVLAADKRKKIDVGLVTGGLFPQGRYFGNGIGIGFDAVVGFVAAKLTWLSGFPSYLVAALETIFLYFQAPQVQIESDSGALEQPALMVSVMNGKRMGGSFHMAPHSRNDDGLFTVCVVGQVSKVGIFLLIPRFIKGDQAGHPAVRYLQTKRIRVKAVRGSLAAHADGETLCPEGDVIAAEVIPSAIDVVCG